MATKTKSKPRQRALSRASEPDPAAVYAAAAGWWAFALGTVERLIADAQRLAKEARRSGSPLAGVVDPDALEDFAGRIGDASTFYLVNCPPEPGDFPPPDPLAWQTADE